MGCDFIFVSYASQNPSCLRRAMTTIASEERRESVLSCRPNELSKALLPMTAVFLCDALWEDIGQS